MALEVHRLSSLVNELTLRCVLHGVDLPNELCPAARRIPPPKCLDVSLETFVPWAYIAQMHCDKQQGWLPVISFPPFQVFHQDTSYRTDACRYTPAGIQTHDP